MNMLKNFNSFDRKLLTGSAFLLIIFAYFMYDDRLIMGFANPPGEVVGQLSEGVNDTRLKYSTDFRWFNVHQGDVHNGDSLFTGPKSKILLTLNDKSVVEVQSNSMITISMLDNQLTLNLKSGQIQQVSGPAVPVVSAAKPAPIIPRRRKPANTAAAPAVPAAPEPAKPVITEPQAYVKHEIATDATGIPSEPAQFTIAWNFAKPDTEYEVQVASDSSFHDIEYSEVTKQKTLTTPGLKAGSHYARVRESQKQDPSSVWSRKVQVEYVFKTPEVPAPAVVANPEIGTPVVKKETRVFTIGNGHPVSLDWEAAQNAEKYTVEVDGNADFKHAAKYTTPETKLVIPNLPPGKFNYRVTATGAGQKVSPPSEVADIKVVVAPPRPEPVKPFKYLRESEDDKGPEKTFVLRWNATPYTKKYLVEIDHNASFTHPQQYETTEPVYRYTTREPGKFVWRVRSLNDKKVAVTEFSRNVASEYELLAPLIGPILREPANDMTLFFQASKENPFVLKWDSVPNAETYLLQISKDADFKSNVIDKSIKGTSYLIADKLPQGDLYWRVRAETTGKYSGWSKTNKMGIFAGRTAQGGH